MKKCIFSVLVVTLLALNVHADEKAGTIMKKRAADAAAASKKSKAKTAILNCELTVSSVAVDANGLQQLTKIDAKTFSSNLAVEPADGSDELDGELLGFSFQAMMEPGNESISLIALTNNKTSDGSTAENMGESKGSIVSLIVGSLKQNATLICTLK